MAKVKSNSARRSYELATKMVHGLARSAAVRRGLDRMHYGRSIGAGQPGKRASARAAVRAAQAADAAGGGGGKITKGAKGGAKGLAIKSGGGGGG